MQRGATAAVLAGGLLQGLALVTVPAASAQLTARSGYDLTDTAYGLVFLPQVVLAIVTSLTGASLGDRFGAKRLLVAGLVLDAVAMSVLVVSSTFERTVEAYPVLLAATAALGAAFGLAVPALNTLAASMHPRSKAAAGLALNALLGLGTALAPVLVAVFAALGAWWLLPSTTAAALLVVTLLTVVCVPRTDGSARRDRAQVGGIRAGFTVIAVAAVLYGFCETMSGNWSGAVLRDQVGAGPGLAAAALAVFWAAVTLGRVVLAGIERVVSPSSVLRFTPVPIVIAFVVVVLIRPGAGFGAVLAFALAGLGCAAMLPQLETLTQQRFPREAEAAASRTIAFYQTGYGVAAFGIGPLRAAGVPFPLLFVVAAAAAAALAVCTTLLTTRATTPLPR